MRKTKRLPPITEEGKDVNRYELEGGYDIIDVSYAMGDGEGFCRTSILKYLARSRFDDGLVDLGKVKQIIERMIQYRKGGK